MSENIKELKTLAEIARANYRANIITREEAKEQIMPYIDAVNARSKELAKKYNQRPKLVNFSSYVR